jgi:hypothetical protein
VTATVKAVVVVGGIFVGMLVIGALLSNNTSTTTDSSNTTAPQSRMTPATYDELAAVVSACGQPTSRHPQELNAGAGSEGRALVYRRYNTELWFYRGTDSKQWMLMSVFPAGGDQTITVAEANRRMPCLKGRLQNHFPGLEQQAAAMKKELGLDDPVKARKNAAASIDKQLLDMGIESRTYTEGKAATTLVIEDALAGRVRANQIGGNASLMAELKLLGFKTLKYHNGFEGEMYMGFHWDLTKNE